MALALFRGVSLWLLFGVLEISSQANPTGGVVVQGGATIEASVPGLTTIQQQSDRAVINWSSFSIGSGEHTQFILPSATSATLNRVLDAGPSLLDGTLTSNGQLYLINASGIVFGQGAVVDVAGLTASTLNLSNHDFMAGGAMTYQGSSTAAVSNAGAIRASTGDVFLIGFQVNNSGSIRAPNGTVGLAAGTDVLIQPVGDERVIVRNAAGPQRGTGVSNNGLIQANVAELKAHGGNVYALAIQNTGRIAATGATSQGGRILLSADGGRIQSTGTLVARTASGGGGQIRVRAGSGGSVDLGGRVDVSSKTGSGGRIDVEGGEITVRRAIAVNADGETAGGEIDIGTTAGTLSTVIEGSISASSAGGMGGVIRLGGASLTLGGSALIQADGATGGGSIFAGGGAQGADAGMVNSTQVQIQQGAVLSANAGSSGNGGTVVAFASGQLTFAGSLQARGGQTGGDGGQAELSGKQALVLESLTGSVDLSAPQGKAGSLLLDPNDILISDAVAGNTISNPAQANTLRASDISTWLNTNCGNLIIQTDANATGGTGNITLAGLIQWSSHASLTINAQQDFIMTTQGGGTGLIQATGSGSVTVNAGRSVQIQAGSEILTCAGNVTLNANQGAASCCGDFRSIVIGGQVISHSGNITLTGRSGGTQAIAILLDNGGSITAGGFGVVSLHTTGGSVVAQGAITSWGLKLQGADDFFLTSTANAVQTITSIGTIGSVQIINTLGLTVGTIGADSGLNALRGVSIITTNTDHIRVNQNLTSQGGVITLTGFGIEVNGSTISNAGTGSIYLNAQREIHVNSGASISVVDGLMKLDANQQPAPTGGNFAGIVLDNATLTTSGAGAIALSGRGGDTGDGNVGILMQNGATIHSTSTAASAGSITLLGTTGGGGSGNHGVSLQDAGTAITSAGAQIQMGGSGAGSGTGNAGVNLGAETAVTSSAEILVLIDTVAIAGAATVGGGGTLELRTVSAGTTIGLGDGAAGTLMIDSAGIGALSGLSHITIGAPTSGYVDVRAATWHAPLTIQTLGEIVVSGQIMDLGGSVTLSASTTLLCAGITTAGGQILISSPLTLGTSATLDTTHGGAVPTGAAITLGGVVYGSFNPTADLTLNAGTQGAVALQGGAGQDGAPIHALSLTGGSLTGTPQIYAQSFTATFSGVIDLSHLSAATASITGRSGDDTILLSQVPASLTVNGAAGNDTLTFAAATGPVTLSADSLISIETIIGSASHADTLIGHSTGGNVFQITAPDAGTLGTLHFSSFENLTGSSSGVNQFIFAGQSTISGSINGVGNPQAVLIVDDSGLQTGQTYTITSSQISVAGRTYLFQGINTIGLNLGAGNDTTSTSFYTFAQNLSGGGGNNQLLVDGTTVLTSPLTKPGFGTITTTGFATSAPGAPPKITNVFLQNFTFITSSLLTDSTQTNNYNTTSIAAAFGAGGVGAQIAGSVLGGASGAGGTSGISSFFSSGGSALGSVGGGGPVSQSLQSQMDSSTSATTERELNLSLGGDGTVRLQNGGGLLSIDSGSGAASSSSVAQLEASMSLLAQSELSLGAIGRAEAPLTAQGGAQSIALGSPLPSPGVQQYLSRAATPWAFSTLYMALGGDGTARLEYGAGSITMEVNDRPVPPTIESSLSASISPGSFGELAHALGAQGEYHLLPEQGLALMDASGGPASSAVQAFLRAQLSILVDAQLSRTLGGDGTCFLLPEDGIQHAALDGAQAGPFVILKLQNATTPESVMELDSALR